MVRAMSVRRLACALSVSLVASVTVVVAQPKSGPTAPVAPAKEAAPAGSAAAPVDAGSAVQMAEEPPPEDMDGTSEDPDAPGMGDAPEAAPVPQKQVTTGFPIEEALRPITLPQNMSEVTLGLGAQVSPLATSGTLRARYGITRQVQLGLTYQFGGFYADEDFLASATGDTKFHPGKAVGLDVTVQLQKWLAVRVGVPVYVDPVAVGITLGAPLRFVLGNKLTLGGMEELLNIRASKFVPSFQYEYVNAIGADNEDNNTTQSSGFVRPSGYAIFQYQPNLALIGRFGVQIDFDGGDTASTVSFMRAGLQFSPRRQIDLGFSIGFDDLSRGGSFSPAAYVSVRI